MQLSEHMYHYNAMGGESQVMVALYVRVSTEEQTRGESIKDQLQALRRYCKERGYKIVGEYLDEGFSARKSYKTRPAMRDLLTAVKRREINLILFTKLDRWFRNVSDYYKVQDIIEKNSCKWQAILEPFETVSAEGKFRLNLLLSFSEHEAATTSERLRFIISEKRRRGEYIGGTPPMGYRVVGGRIEKDPAMEPAVNAMFDTFLRTKSRQAAYDAAAELGYSRQMRTMVRAMNQCSETHTGKTNGMEVEPYLTMDQALEIESALKYRGRMPKEQFIFAGLVTCGVCGGRMSGHRNYTNRNRDRKYRLYNCTNHYNYASCPNTVNMRELDLEEQVLAIIEPELNLYRYNASRKPRQKQRQDNEKRRKAIEQRKARLLDAYLEGIIEKEAYRAKLEAIDAEIAAIPVTPEPIHIPAKLPAEWKSMYEVLTTENKREFWHGILSTITIHADRRVELIFRP